MNDCFRCWHKSPEERPSMDEVVEIMTTLSQFFSEHLEPVEYSQSSYKSIKYKCYIIIIKNDFKSKV